MGHFSQDFVLGLESLEDLQELAGSELLPVVQRAQYHFGELKRSLDDSQQSTQGLDSISRLLKHYLKTVFDQFILRSKNLTQLNSYIDENSLSLVSWNRLIESLPIMIQLLESFPLQGIVKVYMKNGRLSIKATMGELSKDFTSHRKNIYRLFRNLCEKRILLTHQLREKDGSAEIEFLFDLRETSDLVYAFDWEKSQFLGFSHIFESYKVGDIASHIQSTEAELTHYYRISHEFELQKVTQEEVQEMAQSGELEMFYFPFLFRALSLIITKKGKIYPKESFGPAEQHAEVSNTQNGSLHFIDFFALVCEDT